ncbi:GntR family transcriptional regulator [uncultured Brachyspira sp.]|uniref:GntR family transcriptional regulator n=1 Tax=uncultured Brachyspira sp. TaxID=221953 RepID=UPI0025CFA47E|nr:GntR family transcriptional regulator [uncultured Brachyspira sp.]
MPKVKNNNADNLIILDREVNEPIGNYAVRCLEYNIINMTLPPGTFISEKIVSEVLSISRTPIREAFSRLEKVHLIEIYPQKGTRVSLIDSDIVEETSFMRMVLEKEIVKIVCRNYSQKDLKFISKNIERYEKNINTDKFYELLKLDNEFHQILFSIANKELTFNLIKDSIKHFNRARIFNIIEMDRTRTLTEHKNILTLINQKNIKKLTSLMELHLTHVKDDMNFLKNKFPEYFK